MRAKAILAILLAFAGGCGTVKDSSQRPLPASPYSALSPASPITLLSRSLYDGVKRGLDTLVADSLFPPSNAGMKVVSLTRNEVVYELNPDLLFTPASTQKMFTAALALNQLGKDFILRTEFRVDTASGTIGVKGFGDPIVSSRELDSIAGIIAVRLPGGRTWKLLADASYFDDLGWGEGWSWDDEPGLDAMYVSPLCLDQNTIEVTVEPAPAIGLPPRTALRPDTRYVSIENSATTVPDTPFTFPGEISRKWRERLNVLTVKGEFGQRQGPKKERLSVLRPELYFATVLGEGLQKRGISIAGVSADTLRGPATEILTFGHRLDSAVTFMNKVSDNLSAEVLLKDAAAARYGVVGSAKAGVALLKQFLAERGIDTVRMKAVDGSGLSVYNLISPSGVVALLAAVYADTSLFPAFYTSLPIAGWDGTLSRRMRGTPAEGNLRAKTGTLFGVTTLSGYVRTRDGELLAFSIFMQKFAGGGNSYREVQDRIGTFLAGLSRRDF